MEEVGSKATKRNNSLLQTENRKHRIAFWCLKTFPCWHRTQPKAQPAMYLHVVWWILFCNKSIFNGYTCILRWVESVFRVVSLVCCRLKIWMLISPRRLWCVVISICSCCVTSFPADCRAFTDSPHDINRSTNAHRNFKRRESSSNAANRDKNDKRLSFHFDWYSSCSLNISWQHLQSWTAFFKTSQVTLLNELI